MQNRLQKVFIVLWLLFSIYLFTDSLYNIFGLGNLNEGLMYLGASGLSYIMHRVRKKQYTQED